VRALNNVYLFIGLLGKIKLTLSHSILFDPDDGSSTYLRNFVDTAHINTVQNLESGTNTK
jgi:GGDEF domain-containing protein